MHKNNFIMAENESLRYLLKHNVCFLLNHHVLLQTTKKALYKNDASNFIVIHAS